MLIAFVIVLLCLSTQVAVGEEQEVEKQVAEAVLPLPASLRAGATVVLDTEPSKRTVLREGTNHLLCRADIAAPGFAVSCHHKNLDPFYTRVEQLFAAGKSEAEMQEILSREIKAGQLQVGTGETVYNLTGFSAEGAVPIMAVYLPHATSESTGLSTTPDNYRPWLMWAGTPMAHVMLPGQ